MNERIIREDTKEITDVPFQDWEMLPNVSDVLTGNGPRFKRENK